MDSMLLCVVTCKQRMYLGRTRRASVPVNR